MTVQTFSVTDTVTVTPSAAEHFAKQLTKSKAKGVRLSLKESGCTGFKYVIDEIESIEHNDIHLPLSNGVSVYIDPEHIGSLRGMVIDYTQEGLNQQLVLSNPNVKNECGCGESFSV